MLMQEYEKIKKQREEEKKKRNYVGLMSTGYGGLLDYIKLDAREKGHVTCGGLHDC